MPGSLFFLPIPGASGPGSSPRPQGRASGPAAVGNPRGFRSAEAAACARPLTARGGGGVWGGKKRRAGREGDGAASPARAYLRAPQGRA